MMDVRESVVEAADGRALKVREAGDLHGVAVVFHHGTPASSYLYRGWVDDATERGIRFIAYDRPGNGGSDPQPGRTVADAAADVRAIADELGIDRFATWGISGGGPHALACAALLPERVTAAAALASVAPYDADGLDFLAGMGEDNVVEFSAALEGRDKLDPLLEQWAKEMRAGTPEDILEQMKSILSPADIAVMDVELVTVMHSSGLESLQNGIDGWADDDIAFTLPWGFDVADIDIPTLLWQGEQDLMVPPAHGRWLAARIPGVDARFGDDGHITMLVERVSDTHGWLLGRS